MARCKRGYLTVDVDISEVIDEIDDFDLLEEIKERKLSLGRDDFDPLEDIRDAYNELLRGRMGEAKVILERLLMPKWRKAEDSETAWMAWRKEN
jgi:hypothetical protein